MHVEGDGEPLDAKIERLTGELLAAFDESARLEQVVREQLGRLFERFYRCDRARGRDQGGTGLGLSIVKHIAQAHQGTVAVDSSLGQGSTFTIILPAAAA